MDWEFGVVIVLLLWILWKIPPARRTNLVFWRICRQLNIIEARTRDVPLAVVEEEWDSWFEDKVSARKGMTWREGFMADERIPWGTTRR